MRSFGEWLARIRCLPGVGHIEAMIPLIASTTTKTGLKIKCVVDNNNYKLGQTVIDEEFDSVRISRELFHGEWNYSITKQDTQVI
ncbi:MAG: hypothetical protein LBT14_11110 [Treponema sp.]|nr:hypothetical protein [Treponema sp.]